MKKLVKIILIIILVILILFGIFIGTIIVDIEKQESLLDKEIIKLQNLDLTKDEVDTTIITKDEYAIIEKTIKDYLQEYSDNGKEFVRYIEEFNFENMFTATNFKNDGPDFINSKGSLSNLKDNLNQSLDRLIEMYNQEYIINLIEARNLDDYYIDMYKEYMFGNGINSFNETIKEDLEDLQNISTDVNEFLNECYSMYDFMSNNRNYWEVEDNTVYFDTDELVAQYNEHINKIIEKSNKLADYETNTDIPNNSTSF